MNKIKSFKANWPKYKTLIKYYLSGYLDRILYSFSPKRKLQASRTSTIDHILFITEDPRIDIIRFFQALKKELPVKYTMLINHSNLDHFFENAGFDDLIYFRNHWDFRRKLSKLKDVDIVHGFCRRCFIQKIVIEEHDLPMVVSAKDTSVNSHGIHPPHWYLKEELPAERFVFEHADALISESLEVANAFRLYGLKKQHPRHYFANYCEEKVTKSEYEKINDGHLHLVYVGSIRGSQDDPKEHGNIQMHWLIRALNDQGIHFHVYPNPNMARVVYEEYYALDKELPCFHMHESLDPKDLAKEIEQYHFGVIPFFNEDTNRSPMKRYYSTSLKIFNYVESGLPIIISNDMGHQRWILQRYGMAIGVDKQDFYQLEKVVQLKNYDQALDRLIQQRQHLLIERQIHRVVEIYLKILSTRETS